MFPGTEIPRGPVTMTTENLFAQIFERKRWIVDQVKQQIDLYDQHLASKCLLAGVSPPPWLWSPSIPSQTSELNKEEIISGLLFPQSRTSIVCPSSRRFSSQQPVTFLSDSVVKQDLTSVRNHPLEEQLLEEEQQHELSQNLVRHVSNYANEEDGSIASHRDFQQDEGLVESVSAGCRQNEKCPFLEYPKNERDEDSIDVTSPRCSQGKTVTESVSTTGCEREPKVPPPGYRQDETEPSTCLDPGLSLAKVQRSRSRQKALELRSSAKASKSRSNSRNDLNSSPSGHIGHGIASLMSDSVTEIKLFKHDEPFQNEVENRNSHSQGKEGDQCFKFSSTAQSSTPCQKVDSVQKYSSGDTSASIAPASRLKSGHLNEMDILQSFEATEEVPAKVNEQGDDPPYKTCNVTPYNGGLARSKSLVHDSSKREQRNLGNSFSGDLGPRNSNPSHCADHEVELLQLIPMTNEVSMLTDAGMSILQSERIERSRSTAQTNRFKAKHSGSIEFSSADLVSRHTISLLQCDDEKELLKPSTAKVEGLLVENITSDDQLEEKAECADRNRFSTAGRGNQTCISPDGTTFVGVNTISKAELLGYVESSSVALQSRHSVLPSDDETLFLKPITVTNEALLVEEDKNGEFSDISSLSISRNVSPAGISVVERKVIVESILQESGTPKDLIDHTKRCDTSCGSKELQPHDSWTKGGSKQCNAKISWPRSSAKEEESAKEYKALSCYTEEIKAGSSTSRTLHDSPVFVNPESPHFDDNEEGNFEELMKNSREESVIEKACTPVSAERVFDVPSLTDPEGNFSADNAMNDIKGHNCLKKETVAKRESPAGHTGVKAIDNEPPESNALSVHIDALTNSLKRRVSLLLPNTYSNISVALQAPGKSSLSDMSQESLLSYRPYLSAEKEGVVFFPKNMSQIDILKHAESETTERSQDKTISEDQEKEREVDPSVVKWTPGNSCGYSVTPATEKISAALDDRLSYGSLQRQTKTPQLKISSGKGFPPIDRDIACTETGVSHGPESSIEAFFCSSSSMESSHQQNKRRKTLGKLSCGMPSSSPGGDVLESGSVREAVHHRKETAYHNFEHYDVELQKMVGSASSTELRLEESFLLKEAGLMIPASLSFRPEQQSIQKSQIAPDLIANSVVRDSVGSPCLPPLSLIGSDTGSPPELEKFIIQTDDENQSSSTDQISHDSFQLPRTTVESATMMEQLCKSACITTPLLHLPNTSKFNSKLELDQSVSTGLLGGMFFSQNLEGNFVFDDFGIGHTGRSYTDSLPVPEAVSSADARNPCTSPTEKLFWYRSLQKSSSSEKRGSRTPDLPCISEENENVYEEAEDLSTQTPKSTSSEKRRSSIQDLPCIAEENENIDETSEAVNEATDSKMKNVSAERKPLGDINENPMKFLPSVSEAKIPVDRQSLDSVNAAFSFTATCNSVKSKARKQNGGNRRFTGKGKENQGGASAARNVKPPSSRFSKPKLSCNSSLTSLGPRLSEKELKRNNIVSNITSFVPLVQQQKQPAGLITGKRDVKVKALEAAEASKRIAEQKENDRKMKKEAMKLERARQEQENLRKQEMEKKKKEEDRKKKEAELACKQEMEKKKREEDRKKKEAELVCKQEMEKKKREEERKKKEAEMADRKRQREEEDNKLKEAKRKRVAEAQRQQREADQKLQAEKIEKELKTQAMEARIKAQKELREGPSNAEKIALGQANSRMPEVRSKIPDGSDDTNASRNSSDDSKVTSNPGKVSEEANTGIDTVEESYDISPYKCSDDEDEEEEDDDNILNNKFVPAWASKSCVLLAVSSQQNVDPDTIFPAKSFCGISQVLLPRKFQSR